MDYRLYIIGCFISLAAHALNCQTYYDNVSTQCINVTKTDCNNCVDSLNDMPFECIDLTTLINLYPNVFGIHFLCDYIQQYNLTYNSTFDIPKKPEILVPESDILLKISLGFLFTTIILLFGIIYTKQPPEPKIQLTTSAFHRYTNTNSI